MKAIPLYILVITLCVSLWKQKYQAAAGTDEFGQYEIHLNEVSCCMSKGLSTMNNTCKLVHVGRKPFINITLTPTKDYGPLQLGLHSVARNAVRSSFLRTASSSLRQLVPYFRTLDIKMKLKVSRIVNGKIYPLVRYFIADPCSHFFAGPPIEAAFTMDGKCNMKKGVYKPGFDGNATLHRLLGDKFFYGRFLIRGSTYGKNFNLFCIICDFNVAKV